MNNKKEKKKSLGTLILTAISALLLIIMTGCTGNNTPGIKGPAIKFTTERYNFGEVGEGQEIAYSFIFTNPGSETLKITKVHPTCGCTVTGSYDKEIAPGAVGRIPVVLKTAGFGGDLTKTIKVDTNIPDLEQISLTLEGKVKVLVEVDPRYLHLGRTPFDGPRLTGEFTIRNKLETPLEITGITTEDSKMSASVDTIENGEEYRVKVIVDPPFEEGSIRREVRLTTTLEEKPEIISYVSYYGVPYVEIQPREVILYPEHIGTGISRVITIMNNMDVPLSVSDVSINTPSVSHELQEIEKGRSYNVIIDFPENFAFQEDKEFMITLKVSSQKGTVINRIPIIDAHTLEDNGTQ